MVWTSDLYIHIHMYACTYVCTCAKTAIQKKTVRVSGVGGDRKDLHRRLQEETIP